MTSRSDNFNRADTTGGMGTPSDGGSAWVQDGGSWGITSNKGYKWFQAGSHDVASLEASSAVVTVEVTLVNIDTSGLSCRVSDNNNHILIYITAASCSIFKKVAGSFTSIGTGTTTWSAGDVAKVSVDASNNFVLKKNGTSVTTGNDSAGASNTRHGLYSFTNFNEFDTFSITDDAGAGGTIDAQLLMTNQAVRRASSY